MKIKRVLLVVKATALDKLIRERSSGSRHLRQLVENDDPTVAGIKPAHQEHVASVAVVREVLARRGIEVVERPDVPDKPIKGCDFVVTVGGDGMVLGVSHAIRNGTPILGVNSAPAYSVGYLTGCRAAFFDATLEALLGGGLAPLEVQRLRVTVGKKTLAEPVLNDVLFCANNPAVMTRYKLTWAGGEELQRSSGVWIATPAGSTSALSSAGGPILPLTSRQYAFVVREAYAPPGSGVRFRSAVLEGSEGLEIECRILDASVFIDGSHRTYPVALGEAVRFALTAEPLRLVRA